MYQPQTVHLNNRFNNILQKMKMIPIHLSSDEFKASKSSMSNIQKAAMENFTQQKIVFLKFFETKITRQIG